jgi:type IV secretion system protein VirB4
MDQIFQKIIKQILDKRNKNTLSNLAAKIPDEGFIPYVCNYDANTILTKSGELLQIIKIDNLTSYSISSQIMSIRDSLRDALIEHIADNKFALWLHTIRRKKDITPKGEFKEYFADLVNDIWVEENELNNQLLNELYITVIIEGTQTSIKNLNTFWHSFSYITIQSMYKSHLKSSSQKLTEVTAKILVDLSEYGATLLGIKEVDGKLYNEATKFFGQLSNLTKTDYPLFAHEISDDLTDYKIAFGNKEIEISNQESKNFASIISLKEYQEIELATIDKFLQLPIEFIITQSIDFIVSKKDLEPFEYQNYILKLSEDENLRQASGIANLTDNSNKSKVNFSSLQTTIMVINNNLNNLQQDINLILEQTQELGIIAIREDVFLEHCFWAQLPANFRFLHRQKIANINRVGGFFNLGSFPTGNTNKKQGQAVTVLRTVLDTPYFFNFYNSSIGNTVIIGPKKSGKTTLLNFLLTQARKFNYQLFYLDDNQSSECFIRALWGSYFKFQIDDISLKDQEESKIKEDFLKLNPLLLPKTNENKLFLSKWFSYLLAFSKEPVNDQELALIPVIIDKIFANQVVNFSAACKYFDNLETKNIYERLKIWHDGGKLSYIFEHEEESDLSNLINGFDLSIISQYKPILLPVVTYILQRIEIAVTNLKTNKLANIIVLDNAWKLIDNKIFAPLLSSWLTRMKQKNTIIIFVIEDIDQLLFNNIAADLRTNLETEIYLPNQEPNQYYQSIFQLSEEEINILHSMEVEQRHFLFKHNNDSVISSFNINSCPEIIKILSSDDITLTAMQEVIKANFNS